MQPSGFTIARKPFSPIRVFDDCRLLYQLINFLLHLQITEREKHLFMRALKNYTEEKLVGMLKNGSIAAFDELYFRYVTRLESFSRTYLKNNVLCEEVIQEVFIQLWDKKDTLDEKLSIKAYLFQMVKHRIFNIFRNKVRELRLDNEVKLDFYSANPVEEWINFFELRDRAYEIIDGLPEVQKKIFKMSRIDGMKNEEISLELKISRRTVEHHIYLALKTLKNKLSPAEIGFLVAFFALF